MAVGFASKFHQIPDALWERFDLFLPVYKHSRNGERPRLPLRNVVSGIFYVLRTGCQWKAMPSQFGSGSAIHAPVHSRWRREYACSCDCSSPAYSIIATLLYCAIGRARAAEGQWSRTAHCHRTAPADLGQRLVS